MNMKRIILPFLLCPLLVWAAPQWLRATDISFLSTSINEGLALASAKNKKLFVRFTASWCLPCQWMDQNTFQDPRLSDDLNTGFISLALDVDSYTGFREKETYGITTLPTLLIFSSSGEVLLRLERTVSAQELQKLLRHLPEDIPAQANTMTDLAPTPGTTHLSKSRLVPIEAPSEKSIPQSAPNGARTYGVEVALFSRYERAVPYVTQLERQLTDRVSIIVNDKDYDRPVYRIVVGRFSSSRQADQLLAKLSNIGLEGRVKDLSEL